MTGSWEFPSGLGIPLHHRGSQSQGWSLGISPSFLLYKPSLFAAHDLSCRVLVAAVTAAAAATTTSTAVAASGRRTIVKDSLLLHQIWFCGNVFGVWILGNKY